MIPRIDIHPNPAAVTRAAANLFLSLASEKLTGQNRFSISLSGGNTPRVLYELLAEPEFCDQIDWSRVDFFWGDERCVPPNHPDSNFNMVKNALFDRLPKSFSPGIFRMRGEDESQKAAVFYESILRKYFGEQSTASFDLLLLGLGEDAHTASLFPGTDAIHENQRWVAAPYVPKLSAYRLTLTPPLLNRAAQTVILASGVSKLQALKHVFRGPYQPDLYPAQIIQPLNGKLLLITDQKL